MELLRFTDTEKREIIINVGNIDYLKVIDKDVTRVMMVSGNSFDVPTIQLKDILNEIKN